MLKVSGVSFVLREDQYRVPSAACSQIELLSVTKCRGPSTCKTTADSANTTDHTQIKLDREHNIVPEGHTGSYRVDKKPKLVSVEYPGISRVVKEPNIVSTQHTGSCILDREPNRVSTEHIGRSKLDRETNLLSTEHTGRSRLDKESNPVSTEHTGISRLDREPNLVSTQHTGRSKLNKDPNLVSKQHTGRSKLDTEPNLVSTEYTARSKLNKEPNPISKEQGFAVPTNNTCQTSTTTERIVQKNGSCNVDYINIPDRNVRFLSDFFTSILDVRWRYLMVMFFAGFVASWFIFSGLWFGVSKLHGDFDVVGVNATRTVPCIWNSDGFVSVLLFSIETQTTIGYGYRYVSEECSLGIVLLIVQSLIGLLIQVFFAGIILTKIQMPKKRSKTIAFSKLACIANVHGELCLMIRIGNLRLSEIVEANMRALFVLRKDEHGNEIGPYTFREMRMGTHGDIDSRLTLWWPATIFHKINKSSPLFRMSEETMKKCEFEIIVIMEGVISSTSLNFQARTSYLQNEVVWGREFAHTFKHDSFSDKFPIDFQHFDDVIEAREIPNISAEVFSKLPENREESDQRSFCLLE